MSVAVHLAGWGAVTGFGAGVDTAWGAVRSGRSSVRPRERSAAWRAPTSVAAEAPGLAGVAQDRQALELAAGAAEEALELAGIEPGDVELVLASTKGDLSGVCRGSEGRGLGSPDRLARRLAARLGVPAILPSVSCACASGVLALALAARRIRGGRARRDVLVVGVDALHPFVLGGFGALHALDPGPCRPFDRQRRGVSLGDGAGAIVLTADADRSLGLRILGHGGANDACHVTGPDREGRGIALAARRALADAALEPSDLDVVHVHGTGTEANDRCEALGLVEVFGGRTPPAFGTKGQTGHTLGAAGVIETILLGRSLLDEWVPSNHGLEEPDVDPALALAREGQGAPGARRGLKIASGFGGVIGALVVGR